MNYSDKLERTKALLKDEQRVIKGHEEDLKQHRFNVERMEERIVELERFIREEGSA